MTAFEQALTNLGLTLHTTDKAALLAWLDSDECKAWETADPLVLAPAETGFYVVAIYEKSGNLLALHGPYLGSGDALLAARDVRSDLGDRAEVYPLWHAEHVGRP